MPDKSQLPQWGEPVSSTRARYQQVIKDLADKYLTENLLLVTHGKWIICSLHHCMRGLCLACWTPRTTLHHKKLEQYNLFYVYLLTTQIISEEKIQINIIKGIRTSKISVKCVEELPFSV